MNETWAESEKLFVAMCAHKLGGSIEALGIDKARRIGTFKPDKNRPIIAKFCCYKHKQLIISSCSKLKGTGFVVSEGFGPGIGTARRKFPDYGSSQSERYRLRFHKLYIGTKHYTFDPLQDCLTEA